MCSSAEERKEVLFLPTVVQGHGGSLDGKIKRRKDAYQLIDRICQGQQVFLDCEVEDVSVFDIDRYCGDTSASGHHFEFLKKE